MLVKAYQCSYGLPCIITRGNNVYGPHQFPEKLVPKFTLLAARGAPLPVHGDGSATRSYLYVEDVAEAFDCVLHRGAEGQIYNIGTQQERSVLSVAEDIARAVQEHLGGAGGAARVEHVRDRLFNDRRYFICDRKMHALGWRERTPWAEGLRRTVGWYLGEGARGRWGEAEVAEALRAHPELGDRHELFTQGGLEQTAGLRG